MSRPVVTLDDVFEADPIESGKVNFASCSTLVGVSGDMFLKRDETDWSYNITGYRYNWQDGRIKRLFECNVSRPFAMTHITFDNSSDDRLALQITDDKLVLHRIKDKGIHIVDSIKVDGRHAQGFSTLNQVGSSDSLVYIQSIDNWSLYYITPGSRKLKHITSTNGTYYDVKLHGGTLVVKSSGFTYRLTVNTSNGRMPVTNFCNELGGTFFLAIGSTDSSLLGHYLGVDCSHIPLLKASIQLTTLPNLDKIALIHQWSEYKLLILRNVSGRLHSSSVEQDAYISNYCRHTGLAYFIQDGKLRSLSVETLQINAIDKKISQPNHLWLPQPLYRDLCAKYVPVLEASTNLPTDLCRLVVSYLDW